MQVPFFEEIISRNGVKPGPQTLKAMIEITPPKTKNELPSIPWNKNKFSPITADVCEALRQLTSVKAEWTLNADYQKSFNKAKSIIKADAFLKFYNETKPLYLETDVSEVGLGADLLQTINGTSCPRDVAPDNNIHRPIIFANKKSIQCREEIQQYRKKIICYITKHGKKSSLLLAKEVSIIRDHKPQLAIFMKDVATFLQGL